MPYGTKTLYKGYTLKSKGEHAWAHFFEMRGLSWEYEPVRFFQPGAPHGLGYTYTPDFAIDGRALFIEIKTWGATVFNNIHYCTTLLLVIFGTPERCYIRTKQAGAARLSPATYSAGIWPMRVCDDI